MGVRSHLRAAAIQTAGALDLDELMLASIRTGALMHAVNFHGTPLATRGAFVRQLEWVRSRFTVMNPMSLGSFWEGATVSHKPYVLLTFDDGLASNFVVAAPVLESLGLRGLFFVNPGFAKLRGTAAREFYLGRLAVSRDRVYVPNPDGHEIWVGDRQGRPLLTLAAGQHPLDLAVSSPR